MTAPSQELPVGAGGAFLQGVKDCIPTVLGYLSIGFAAGVIGKTSGLSVMEIVLMSVFVYAGSAQFIMSAMLAAGSPGLAITMTVFLVNLRHLLMSASVAPYFKHLPIWKNLILGAQLTDETFGVASTMLPGRERGSGRWMLGLNMTAQVNWVLATAIGAVFGLWIEDPTGYGLDFALPGMFIGLLVLQLLARSKWRVDLIVMGTAVAATLIGCLWLSPSLSVLAAIVIAATAGMAVEAWR
ncbi:AzlC family ABC transporter permease [Gorillibacterium sp. sgz5001074]|uniref:AzlC family ABC transporter permease n=1 Tax=Gorillibacterium sp. sgz5001074 TaxID=3446695 RepID=UPI003F675CC8